MSSWLDRHWYGSAGVLKLLSPLEGVFSALAQRRRQAYQQQRKPSYRASVPVVVVGNISIGGTGKTPFTLWLLEQLKQRGLRPGVVSRGYGGKAPEYPFAVTAQSRPEQVGDEPLMLASHSGCPLVVDPDRGRAVRHLLQHHDCDLIVSDDGLQHYALQRDIEIVLIDGQRGFGNGHCLPVGPLREPPSRLEQVGFIVINGQPDSNPQLQSQLSALAVEETAVMALRPGGWRRLDGEAVELAPQSVHAVAGIGNPQRFYDTLGKLGFEVNAHSFVDHHRYQEEELQFEPELPLVMTEKDAVKCRAFSPDNRYYLPVTATLPVGFQDALLTKINQLVAASAEERPQDARNKDG
ncbi:tetraacyldisaccharide 4'-kinase [Motiliproteus coralliicola]|uniref:Tetraacyldisaccharide 4'-kinase n=1 Tax=Motiliproteus coralliicola TaxID=2283196 RepID=A0A369WUN6_9GAMM|nr:tetraacyldisaccharide 4'-kinase [Motiliproteus coralliicola]RDE24779.1 tetraacyldisaccharide 4'-kinase [Motiliproteus coralliicola]